MIPRILAAKLREAVRRYPVVSVTGPRQSGKTTLVRNALKGYDYVSLELPDERGLAIRDPRAFLGQFTKPAIIDEAQRAPELFSYIQVAVDEQSDAGRFVLTGSQNFLLLQAVSQSLAGRCAVLHLLPFSQGELGRRPPAELASLGTRIRDRPKKPPAPLAETLFTGFYPRIHDRELPPREWLANYYQTYLERDVRNVLNVGDIETFGRFVRLCAARNAQLLNLSSLASDCGITHTSARRWVSVLEASFLILLLRPHHHNLGKRLIKSPKLYFLDSGLLCYLLGIRSPAEIVHHSLRGAIFETLILSELHKNFLHRGEPSELYFWRDSTGHEVDFVVDMGNPQIGIEAKSGETIAEDFFDGLRYWRTLARRNAPSTALVYGGDRRFVQDGISVHPWFVL
jgi:predicted AAA+ superfamily ATPase